MAGDNGPHFDAMQDAFTDAKNVGERAEKARREAVKQIISLIGDDISFALSQAYAEGHEASKKGDFGPWKYTINNEARIAQLNELIGRFKTKNSSADGLMSKVFTSKKLQSLKKHKKLTEAGFSVSVSAFCEADSVSSITVSISLPSRG